MSKLKITDTTLRDAHQSLIATRMRTEHMLPICEKIDKVGYRSLEMFGGATFDSMMRFLDEDPWERVEILKEVMPKTPFQMLLRAQNVVSYRHYADDVLEAFVVHAVKVGIDVFRIFDALNDVRNMEAAMKFVKREGGHVQASFCYTLSPFHTNQKFVEKAKQLYELEADSICIKDMAGLISPKDAFELVTMLKDEIDIPIQLHSHYTSGMASMAYLKGADGVFIGGCDPGDCHYVEGNLKARRRFGIMQSVFSTLGLEPDRLRLAWISASEGEKFASQMKDLSRSIKELGQNPTADEMFL